MNQQTDEAIVLTRRDFGEADRIVTFLTKNHGKITGMVKGARRSKSKMAGGVELFSISHISFIVGKGEMKTIVSTRLNKHFGQIVQDVDKTMWAYEALKLIDKTTEEECGPSFFELCENLLETLADAKIELNVTKLWFYANLLGELGHNLNTKTDNQNKSLTADQNYAFDFEAMAFKSAEQGELTPNHIKFLRLAENHQPKSLTKISGAEKLATKLLPIAEQTLRIWAR